MYLLKEYRQKKHPFKKQKKYHSLKPLINLTATNQKVIWPQQFSREAPLHIEIGFGEGDFLIRQSLANPQHNFIGIEYQWLPLCKTLRKLVHNKNDNVRLVFMNARLAFKELFVPKSLSSVYVLFPDPWFKRKHMKHRLLSYHFLKLINNRLMIKGILEVVTDNLSYYKWINKQARSTGFELQKEKINPQFDTKYERKWFNQGQKTFYRLSLRKKQHITRRLSKEGKLKTYHIDDFDPEGFQPRNQRGDDVAVTFKEFLFDKMRSKAMVRVAAMEDDVTQQFWIAIIREKDRWCIRVAEGCVAVPTLSVQQALSLTYEACVKSGRALAV